MALPNVNINVIGAINRPALNKDGVTGFLFYNDNIADLTSFSATNRVIKFTNISSVEAVGITSTSTNFQDEWYYLDNFFAYGGTEVWIGIFEVPVSAYGFTELDTMKNTSDGEIRIYAIPTGVNVLDSTDVLLIQSIVEDYEAEKKPAIALYSADTGTIELGNLEDMRGLSGDAPHVSVVNGQDQENEPAIVTSYSLPNMGAVAGTLAQAKVSENILNVGKYNYSNGIRMNLVALRLNNTSSDDVLIPISDIDVADLNLLNDKGYIFWRYFPNLAGSYLSNDNNSVIGTNTFNSIHIMRQRNKAVRKLDTALTPLVGASLLFNADGTLRTASAKVYENAASLAMQEMVNDSEISTYSVFVDTTVDSLATKTVVVNVEIIPVESSDNITINIAFVQALTI